jgi:hypothetical protein
MSESSLDTALSAPLAVEPVVERVPAEQPVFAARTPARPRAWRLAGRAAALVVALWLVALLLGTFGLGYLPGIPFPGSHHSSATHAAPAQRGGPATRAAPAAVPVVPAGSPAARRHPAASTPRHQTRQAVTPQATAPHRHTTSSAPGTSGSIPRTGHTPAAPAPSSHAQVTHTPSSSTSAQPRRSSSAAPGSRSNAQTAPGRTHSSATPQAGTHDPTKGGSTKS